MIPSLAHCKDLPMSVKVLASAIAYLVKTEAGITTSLKAMSTAYDIPEKKFQQAINGVKYESGLQHKCKLGQTVTPEWFKDDEAESSSSSDDDDGQTQASKHKNPKK